MGRGSRQATEQSSSRSEPKKLTVGSGRGGPGPGPALCFDKKDDLLLKGKGWVDRGVVWGALVCHALCVQLLQFIVHLHLGRSWRGAGAGRQVGRQAAAATEAAGTATAEVKQHPCRCMLQCPA